MKQIYLAMAKALRDCGYRVDGKVLNAMYFGVPQQRKRVIIIGVRNDLDIEPSHPKPMMRPLSAVIVVMPPAAIDTELLEKLMGIIGDTIENELPKIVETV